ncbi:MAG: phytanoyl-CoA dioxygenase family protein [Alphaproteobacteria bacterium]|nr:phytanoyl-CoA dioxygenase family protein [Alphaproteobacteria bacterium]MBM3951261.1 phytanoyl-CoA dioxygenase family protein [Rhodospirillales bacterium]
MNRTLARPITEEEIEAYHRDGVIFLKDMFDRDWIERLRELADWDMSTPGKMQQELAKKGDSGRFYNNTFLWPRHDGFKDFIFGSPAAEIVGTIMRSKKINIFFDQFLIKEPKTRERTMWHHDLTYWPVNGSQVCTLWLALDDVTKETGAVEYVKGSHRWNKRFKAEAFLGDGRYTEDLPPVPDIENMRSELQFAQYELKPGDCTVHHALTVHGAPGNTRPDRRRRAYITRWAGDDAVYYPRPNIQPMLWEPNIPAGGPLDSDLWPRVWTRAA